MYTQTPRNPGRLFVVPAPVPRQMISFTDGRMNKNMTTKEHMSDDMKATVRCILNIIPEDQITGGGVVQAKQVRAVGCRRIEHAALACVSQLLSRLHSHAFPNAPADCVRIRFPTPQRAALACVSQRPGGMRSRSFPNSPSACARIRFPTPAGCARFRVPAPKRAGRAFVSQRPNELRSPHRPARSARKSALWSSNK